MAADPPIARPQWRTRDFLLFWGGETVSALGTQVTYLALPLAAILTLHATSAWVGLVTAGTTLPVLIVTPLAGVWVDRHRSRPLMLVAHIARAVTLAAIPLLAWAAMLTLPTLLAVALLVGGFSAAFEIAYLSYVPTLVDRDALVRANSAIEGTTSVADTLGPGLAGVLIQLVTAPGAILFDAVSYAVAGWTVLAVRSREPAREASSATAPDAPRATVREMARDIADGARRTLQDPILRGLIAVSASFNFFEQAVMTNFLLYTSRVLHLRAGTIGLALAAGGIGTMAGTVFCGRVGPTLRSGLALGGGMAIASVSLALLPAVADIGLWTPIAFGAIFALYGLGLVVFNIYAVTLRQLHVPPDMLGRVNAGYRTITYGAMPLGALAGGAVGGLLGFRVTLALAGAGLIAGAVVFLRSVAARLRGVLPA
ncbi:MFS transporter [Actinomadura sp. DC4]|uniref:MFS transporter n=1 Tax=Actinomadura sp. DC4 TaxID=3055069 RepID=UPI0025B24E89|nr:MFS transporter [Actinomadura sp. DC4]MDN3358506.1 MFS transporter [Actinomadura sp. DC4]